MMTVLELENLISSGEGYNTEFKVSFPSKVKEITEEICAFAKHILNASYLRDSIQIVECINVKNKIDSLVA